MVWWRGFQPPQFSGAGDATLSPSHVHRHTPPATRGAVCVHTAAPRPYKVFLRSSTPPSHDKQTTPQTLSHRSKRGRGFSRSTQRRHSGFLLPELPKAPSARMGPINTALVALHASLPLQGPSDPVDVLDRNFQGTPKDDGVTKGHHLFRSFFDTGGRADARRLLPATSRGGSGI